MKKTQTRREPPTGVEGKFRAVAPAAMIEISQAAKLSGIPPTCLEIGRALLKAAAGSGMRYELAPAGRPRGAEASLNARR